MLRQFEDTPPSGGIKSEPALAKAAAVLLGLLLAVAAFLHVYGIGDKALWYDEVTTALYGGMPVSRLWRILAAEDFHPPLYFLLQRPFLALPLPVEWQLRLMPLISAAAAAVLAELIVRRMGGARWAGAVMGAFFPGLVVYAQEARVYATLTALEFTALYGVLRTREAPLELRWPALAIGALWLAAAMHYLAILFIVPVGLALLWASGRRGAVALMALGAAALYAPWLPHVVHAFFSRSSHIANVAPRQVDGASIWGVFAPHWGGGAWAAAVAVVSVAALACAAAKRAPGALLLVLLAVFPWVLFAVLPPKYPYFHPRYFLPWAALPVLIVPLVTAVPLPRMRSALAVFLALVIPAFAHQSFAHDRAPRTWNRELAAMSPELFVEGDLLVIEPYYQSIAVFYYLPLSPHVRENALENPMKVIPTLVVDPNGVNVVASAVDFVPQVVGNTPLSERVYILAYGEKSPSLSPMEPDMVEVKRWPHATLYRLNKRIWADPSAGHVYIGNRPVARWVPAKLQKVF